MSNTAGAKPYRVLMFAPAFAPFANPEAIVNNKLALAFQGAGWSVAVVSREQSLTYKYDYGSEWSDPWQPLAPITYLASYKIGGKAHRIADTTKSMLKMGHPVVGCRWAGHAYDMALKLHSATPFDAIISRSLPEVGHLPALKIAQKTKLPWIANWNDPHLLPNQDGKLPPFKYFHKRFLCEVAQQATWHTFPSERMRRYVCSYLGNRTERKSSTIPHAALPPSASLPQWKQNKIFTMCYAGHLYSGRDPSSFFEGMSQFINSRNCHTKCKLLIIGLEEIGLQNIIQKHRLESNVHIIGPLSYTKTLETCSSSDVLLVIEAAYHEGIFLPSKFVDYVQCGRPILAISPINGAMHDILHDSGGGIAADCTSKDAIASALVKLFDEWEMGTLDKNFSSDRLYRLYSPETVIKSYKAILHNAIEGDFQGSLQ
jgi:glycosyltransferase involved in cell wall biosynthesis